MTMYYRAIALINALLELRSMHSNEIYFLMVLWASQHRNKSVMIYSVY